MILKLLTIKHIFINEYEIRCSIKKILATKDFASCYGNFQENVAKFPNNITAESVHKLYYKVNLIDSGKIINPLDN